MILSVESNAPGVSQSQRLYPDPFLSANIYCTARLSEVIAFLVAPFWRSLCKHEGTDTFFIWALRYNRRGEHLKVRLHGPASYERRARALLGDAQRRFFCRLVAPEPARKGRSSSAVPPIDLQDEIPDAVPDRSFLWTDYRRSHISLGYQPYLGDDDYVSLLVLSLGRGMELVLNGLTCNAKGQFPALAQRALLVRAVVAGLTAVFPSTRERSLYMLYHRDTLIRSLRNQRKIFWDPQRYDPSRLETEIARLVSFDNGAALSLDPSNESTIAWERGYSAWRNALRELSEYAGRICGDREHHVDPFAEEALFPAIFKSFHGLANQMGIDHVMEAFVFHLIVSRLADGEVRDRPVQLRPLL